MPLAGFISGLVLLSPEPAALAAFYRDVLGIALQAERHGPNDSEHYACELGDVHFAIHHGGSGKRGTPAFKLAFAVSSLRSVIAHIGERGYSVLYPPEDLGFAVMTALLDLDGNYVELTELSDEWMHHLRTRRESGSDPILSWHESRERGGS